MHQLGFWIAAQGFLFVLLMYEDMSTLLIVLIGSVTGGFVARLLWIRHKDHEGRERRDLKRQLDAANETIKRYRAEKRGYR